MKIVLLALLVAALSSACTTTGSGPELREGAEAAVSAQDPTGDIQKRAKVHTELGSLYLLDGRAAVALEEARIALSVDPSYAPAYNLLGMTHQFLNEPRLAEENYQKALRVAPGDPEIRNNYGWFLCQNGRERESLAYLLAAARNPLYQTPTRALTNAGICSIRLKDDKAAEDYLLQALQLVPENTLALYWLADLNYRHARYVEAKQGIADIEKLVEPTAEVAWLSLRIERKLGNREAEARQAAQIRRRYVGTPEHRKLIQGQYE